MGQDGDVGASVKQRLNKLGAGDPLRVPTFNAGVCRQHERRAALCILFVDVVPRSNPLLEQLQVSVPRRLAQLGRVGQPVCADQPGEADHHGGSDAC